MGRHENAQWEMGQWVVDVVEPRPPPQNEADHGKISVVTGSGWVGPLRLQRLKFQFVLW